MAGDQQIIEISSECEWGLYVPLSGGDLSCIIGVNKLLFQAGNFSLSSMCTSWAIKKIIEIGGMAPRMRSQLKMLVREWAKKCGQYNFGRCDMGCRWN